MEMRVIIKIYNASHLSQYKNMSMALYLYRRQRNYIRNNFF